MTDQPARILLLEDNPVQRSLYERVLQAAHYEVLALGDPKDLVTQIDTLPPTSAILLDIMLPGIDGIALMQLLQGHPAWCRVPTVLMTATPTRDRVVSAQKVPVPPEGFLVKPFDVREMLRVLRAVIQEEEPLYLLRSMQRRRLELRITLTRGLEDIEAELREAHTTQRDYADKLAEARRETQNLRMTEAHMQEISPEVNRQGPERIQELEQLQNHYRELMVQNEGTRQRVLRKRQEILNKQKLIRDLERRCQALASLMQGGKLPAKSFPGAPGSPEGRHPESELKSCADSEARPAESPNSPTAQGDAAPEEATADMDSGDLGPLPEDAPSGGEGTPKTKAA